MKGRTIFLIILVGFCLVGLGAVGAWASTSSASVGNVPVVVPLVVAVTAPQGVKAGQVFNVPLTVTVQVGDSALAAAPAKMSAPVKSGTPSGVDSLGIGYELVGDWTGLEVVSWEAMNLNGDMGHAVAGTVKVTDAKRTLIALEFNVHYYDGQGKLMAVQPGQTMQGIGDQVAGDVVDLKLWGGVNLPPEKVGRYVVEVRAVWE